MNLTATTESKQQASLQFQLLAGNVCLDFINTLDNRFTSQPIELLKDFRDLIRFCEQSGVLSHADAARWIERSQSSQRAAEQTLRSAIEMREAMFAVFMAVVKRNAIPDDALARLNGAIQYAARHARLVRAKSGFAWQFDAVASPERPLDPVLWPIARAAAELLASDLLHLVGTCSAEACQWFFLDTSKNHHRRWCSMQICGNREKVRKFYGKKKAE
jgi:predicted RNA-binding Zn ribbon-like protein